MARTNHSEFRCYFAVPSHREFKPVIEAVEAGSKNAGYKFSSSSQASTPPGSNFLQVVFSELAQADCVIADITIADPDVFFEIGAAQAMGKRLLTISAEGSESRESLIQNVQFAHYESSAQALKKLRNHIEAFLNQHRKSPQRSQTTGELTARALPFFIDWQRLEVPEIENLCKELLSQMGFQRLEWGKITPEIDLVAQLPRKDPDGFEFRELWLITFGRSMPLDMFTDMMSDSDYLMHRLSSYSNKIDKAIIGSEDSQVTLLIILPRESREYIDYQRLIERAEKRRFRRGYSNFRFRIWDQSYLTSLVHQFPQLGYKYFSDEGRIRSKTRMSYEDLYRENSTLMAHQRKLILDLEDEKNKRVSAERDAVWKDISFSAAHKIGNPLFAIETELDPLLKRLHEQRTAEAEESIDNIRSAVEKAKNFVGQFKSLARSQEINPSKTLLLPLLQDTCRSLKNTGIKHTISCPPDLELWVDSDRISECFDELVMNAIHWLDKPDKAIEFAVVLPAPEPLPSFLDTRSKYALIHIRDNGPGIEIASKQKIFDAFFTTYDHGTGLGLALVRRIIDGHGGGIVESGIPGQGADFEIYLPLTGNMPPSKPEKASTT